MTLEIPRELKSPNQWQGRHWRYKHRETQEWETEIKVACILRDRYHEWKHPLVPFRRRVTITRVAPSKRHFIRDDDNLRFATKPLNDALKRLGLVFDDSRRWLEQPMPTQEVSNSGGWVTVVQIENIEG